MSDLWLHPYRIPATYSLSWAGRSQISSPADGVVVLSNAAGTALTGLKLGAATGEVPYLKVSGTVVTFRNATDDANVSIAAKALRSVASTVAGLGTASGAGSGARGWVSDAVETFTAANFGATVTGGGANGVPVVSDGTNWKIG